MKRTTRLFFLILMALQISTSAQPPKYEFRGAWIATINRIDWPSVAGASAEKQKMELMALLDTLYRLNYNTVIFQIRPAADAFYRSQTEPWSAFLTGQQGKAPDMNWDPLTFIIEECHKRDMELHAWLNPYRVSQNKKEVLSERNIGRRQPDWTLDYDNKTVLDPGIPAVRDYLNQVVAEVVSRYDVDAIHLDDYFYPYPVAKQPFPDTMSFRKFNRDYPIEKISDWRRENVDLIIESLSQTIKRIKPFVKFGVSPFGVWRNSDKDPTGSATMSTVTNYDDLYADVIKWQKNGWIDYLIPQIYWEIGHPAANYTTLNNWWANQAYGRHMYNGLATYKASEAANDAWKNPNQLSDQIMMARNTPSIQGTAMFRMKFIVENPRGTNDSIHNKLFNYKSLNPKMPWIDDTPPNAPDRIMLRKEGAHDVLFWMYRKTRPSLDFKTHIVYYSTDRDTLDINNPENMLGMTTKTSFTLNSKLNNCDETIYLWVTSIDRLNNESQPIGPIKYKRKK